MLRALLYGLLVTELGALCTTTLLHRSETHGSVEFNGVVRWLLRFGLWITTGIFRPFWDAVHRVHHAHTDVPGDPHSPLIEGFWPIQIFNVVYYRKSDNNPEVLEWVEYFRQKEDWWDRTFFNHGPMGLGIGIILLCLILGLKIGLLAAGIHVILYVFLLTPSINGLCHVAHPFGYQHTTAKHAATTFNNWLVALLTAGEGFHHFHHWKQNSAIFAHTWWEVPADWGGLFIRLLTKLRLATITHSQPTAA